MNLDEQPMHEPETGDFGRSGTRTVRTINFASVINRAPALTMAQNHEGGIMSSPPAEPDQSPDELGKLAKRTSGFTIVLSILLIVCGFLAILLPIEMSLGVVIVISWLLMISGVVQFIHAIRGRTAGSRLWT